MLTRTCLNNDNSIDLVKKTTSLRDHLWDLFRLCIPLMLSALSSTLMIFLDRVVLAKYNTQLMIEASLAANIFYIFHYGTVSVASVAAVFVGRFNGAKHFTQVGNAVWQMIWFSLFSAILMIGIGLLGSHYLMPEHMLGGRDYFTWIMMFGGSFPLAAALSAFFIGRKQVKLVTLSIILGNVLNLLLAVALVFGVPGFMPTLGAKGAAIATGIAESTVALFLLLIFLNRTNRQHYHTHRYHLNVSLIMQSLKIGFPNAIGHMCSGAAWSFILVLLAKTSEDHLTVMTIGLNIWLLFTFMTDSLQKSVTALSANYIGARNQGGLSKVLMMGLALQLIFAVLIAVPLVFLPKLFVSFFVPLQGLSASELAHLTSLIEMTCRCLWIAYIFDGMAWVVDGMLTAAGDARFIMLMNSIGTWILFIGPIYLFIVKGGGSPLLTLQLMIVFCVVLFFSYMFRYIQLSHSRDRVAKI